MSSDHEPVLLEKVDRLDVRVYLDRETMGRDAARRTADRLRNLQEQQDRIRMIFAAAPSQDDLLQSLIQEPGIDWSAVTAFHMDEYLDLSPDAPQQFSQWLLKQFFNVVQPGEVHLIDSARPAKEECLRYSQLLVEAPIDIVCLGIGENGHLAFNDPPVADFDDPYLVKPVRLDAVSRQQQVNDGAFAGFDDVPEQALTLTIPALMAGKHLCCVVPGEQKRWAVRQTLDGRISTECPASILRRHDDCTLYVDKDAFGRLPQPTQ